ncbi:MAG: c-type cytochrome biogenesis protein CcmI [Alphaproteobacteria bacterium]
MTDAVLFWAVAVIVTGFVLFALLPPLLGRTARLGGRDASAQRLYRSQLKQIDDDVARGQVSAGEAETMRSAIARRLLQAADGADSAEAKPQRARRARGWAATIALAAPVAAVAVYLGVGQPGMPDQPIAGRKDVADIEQARHTAEALISEMTLAVERDPDDLRSWVLLGRAYAGLDRLDEAADAYAHAVALAPGQADLSAAYGEILVMQAGGQVTEPAVAAFRATLDQVPDDPRAQYYLALADLQRGDAAAALAGWQRLASESLPDAPWMEAVNARIAEAEQVLGADATRLALGDTRDEEASGEAADADAAADSDGIGETRMADAEPATTEAAQAELAAEAQEPPAPPPAPPAAVAAAPMPAERSSVQGTGATVAPGPSQQQIDDMMALSAEEQSRRIGEMVAGLAARLQDDPQDVDGWMMLARSYVNLGQIGEAENALANASRYGPTRVDAQIAYVRMLLQDRPVDAPVPTEAVAALTHVIEQDPTHPDALWLLGLAAAQQRDFPGARQYWQRLLDTLEVGSEAYVDVQSYIAALADGSSLPDGTDGTESPVDSTNAVGGMPSQ